MEKLIAEIQSLRAATTAMQLGITTLLKYAPPEAREDFRRAAAVFSELALDSSLPESMWPLLQELVEVMLGTGEPQPPDL